MSHSHMCHLAIAVTHTTHLTRNDDHECHDDDDVTNAMQHGRHATATAVTRPPHDDRHAT